jgi:hypothetical protein
MGKIGFGRLGRVIDHAINKFVELIIETRKGYNQYTFMYTPSGDNSVPLKEDRMIIIKIDGTGRFIAAGVLVESQGAKPGEKIFFARDAKGNIVSKLTMLNDGLVSLDTNTETTGEATGQYKRTIKGKTTVLEKDDRDYTNEKNVNETIEGDQTIDIAGDQNVSITGSITENVTGKVTETTNDDREISVTGGMTITIGGSLNLNVDGAISINGQSISSTAENNITTKGNGVIIKGPSGINLN